MRKSNFALRLQPSIMEEAKEMARDEGVALNQLINIAMAEKLAASRTRAFFARYTRRRQCGTGIGSVAPSPQRRASARRRRTARGMGPRGREKCAAQTPPPYS